MLNRSVVPHVILGGLLLTALARGVEAQACFGLAPRGGVAYENIRYSVGTGHAVNAGVAAGHVALGGSARVVRINDVADGYEGGIRIAGIIPISRVQLCPGIGVNYRHDDWVTRQNATLATDQLALRAGAGIGMEQPIYKGFSLIPSVGVHYQFDVYKFDVKSTSANEITTTGDTVSRVAIDYGLVARYRFLYVGVSAARFSDAQGIRPSVARYIIGFAFGNSSPKRRED